MPLAALLLPFAVTQNVSIWKLHKFMQPIGTERASAVGRDEISTEFGFTDRGTPVNLTARFNGREGDLTSLKVEGKTSRGSSIDRKVTIAAGRATIEDGGKKTVVAAPKNSFPSPGYAPLALQESMLRFWNRHGRPKAMPNLTGGTIRIVERGKDTVEGKPLHRYLVRGVIWGRETLWTDERGTLVAGVMCDAEFDHFEGIADQWESSLPFFVRKAAEDEAADLAKSVKPPKAASKIALVNGHLIDGTGAAPIDGATVLIENGKIVGVGKGLDVPAGFEKIDVMGKTVMPGLWDMHAHYEQVEWGPIYLASGVTTVRDCGNEFDFITAARDANDRGGVGPRLVLAGLVDGTGPISLGIVRVDTEEQVKAAVARYKAAGFRQIKIYSSVKLEMIPIIVREAHSAGMTVTGHVPEGVTLDQFIEAGVDGVNHIQYPVSAIQDRAHRFQPIDPASEVAKTVVERMRSKGVVMDDTLVIFETMLHRPAKPDEIEPGLDLVAPELKTPLTSMFGTGLPGGQALLDSWAQLVVAMQKAGVPVVAGTDQTVPGHSLHHELELYVRAGMSPMDAIRAACEVPAKVMKMDAEVGTLEPGKRADIVVVDGDPIKNISATRNVWMTFAKGKPYLPSPLWKSVGFKPPK